GFALLLKKATDPTYTNLAVLPAGAGPVSVTNIPFRYLFASKEYQQNFPCTITDGFALLLKKATDPTYTNLAVLPAGAGPVSVTNI
ncbi:choice-of-anchor L domain-containing protein, partial [Chryseobacterium sp. CH1]|uniref:choice-of-anchor L domain-containing protein n=1 Tax=Chryseobacterium sp. CH1 TaxID=713551 RepID=UPI001028473F